MIIVTMTSLLSCPIYQECYIPNVGKIKLAWSVIFILYYIVAVWRLAVLVQHYYIGHIATRQRLLLIWLVFQCRNIFTSQISIALLQWTDMRQSQKLYLQRQILNLAKRNMPSRANDLTRVIKWQVFSSPLCSFYSPSISPVRRHHHSLL